MNLDTFVKRRRDVEATDLDGEKAMMDMKKGKYFLLNGVGGYIWDIIEDGIAVKDIVNRLYQKYEVDKEHCEKTAIKFLEGLKNEGLITIFKKDNNLLDHEK